ncbi:MAG: hypothetical protein SFU84_03930 [Gemmatimonadales bacterium]|nr:hypothetical protein [Gemmatimonadales bacterium]
MDVERPTTEDMRADLKRTFRWAHMFPIWLWMAAFFVAKHQLNSHTPLGSSRVLWFLLPLPFMIWAFWGWRASERVQDEFARAITGRAAVVAVRCIVFFIWFLALIDAAYGMPLRIPAPFGLPDEEFGWVEAAFVIMFIVVGTGIRETSKVFPKK